MERFYLKCLEGLESVTVVYRPTHEAIVNINKEDSELVESLCNMDTEEFVQFIRSNILIDGFYRRTNNKLSAFSEAYQKEARHDEEWYSGAWSYTTKKYFDEYGIEEEIPTEDPMHLLDVFKAVVESERKEQVEIQEKKRKLRRRVKQQLLDEGYSGEELRDALKQAESTIEEVVSKKRLIKRVKQQEVEVEEAQEEVKVKKRKLRRK